MMRHIFRMAALALTMCICGTALAEQPQEQDKGWRTSKTSDLTEEALAAFERAKETITDAVYEPVALLGENGGEYCILCRVTYDDPETEPFFTVLYTGKDGIQNTWYLDIEEHSTQETADEEERTTGRAALPGDLAMLQDAWSRYKADMKELENDELAVFVSDAWMRTYMNDDYRLYIDGKDNPAEIPVSGKHAFVVLGFELQDGAMTEELKERCDAAASAAGAFPESFLICSGGATGDNNPEGHTEAGLMKEYLVQSCGIAEERILTDETASTTLENAINTVSILKDQNIEEITIVTSSYHQRRANILYETLLEIVRETEGRSITIAGNYSCEREAPPESTQYDAWIAAMQLQALLSSGTADNGEK